MGDASAYEDQYGKRVRQAHKLSFLIGPGRSLSQAAITFVRHLAGVTVTLPRAVTVAELEENLGSLRLPPFTDAELRKSRPLRTDFRTMDRRRLGSTELEVSEIGLGCQSLGGGLYHRDDREATRVLLGLQRPVSVFSIRRTATVSAGASH